jgi:hypothetical protein
MAERVHVGGGDCGFVVYIYPLKIQTENIKKAETVLKS